MKLLGKLLRPSIGVFKELSLDLSKVLMGFSMLLNSVCSLSFVSVCVFLFIQFSKDLRSHLNFKMNLNVVLLTHSLMLAFCTL